MKKVALIAAIAALSLTAACETTGGGYGGGGGGYGGTRLSQCMRNALIGAGVGAVAGVATAPEGNKTENAAIGAAIGGLGTFGVCKYLNNSEQNRIEGAYRNALASNAPVGMNWVSTTGQAKVLQVARPMQAGGNCKTLSATLQVGGQAPQPLPQETYCYNGSTWAPAAY